MMYDLLRVAVKRLIRGLVAGTVNRFLCGQVPGARFRGRMLYFDGKEIRVDGPIMDICRLDDRIVTIQYSHGLIAYDLNGKELWRTASPECDWVDWDMFHHLVSAIPLRVATYQEAEYEIDPSVGTVTATIRSCSKPSPPEAKRGSGGVRYLGKTVWVAGNEFEVDHVIREAFRDGNKVIILYSGEDLDGEAAGTLFDSLVAYDLQGNKLWTAQDPEYEKTRYGYEAYAHLESEYPLKVWTWSERLYWIDVETGRIERTTGGRYRYP